MQQELTNSEREATRLLGTISSQCPTTTSAGVWSALIQHIEGAWLEGDVIQHFLVLKLPLFWPFCALNRPLVASYSSDNFLDPAPTTNSSTIIQEISSVLPPDPKVFQVRFLFSWGPPVTNSYIVSSKSTVLARVSARNWPALDCASVLDRSEWMGLYGVALRILRRRFFRSPGRKNDDVQLYITSRRGK